MVARINGQLRFCYVCPTKTKKTTKRRLYIISLLGILIGIFLLPQVAYLSAITSEKLIELTNQERVKVGLNALTANQLLTQAAYEKGRAIIETQTFQHNIGDKKFSNWIRDTGYKYSYVGENLAIDFVTSEGVVNAWLNSPSHRNNLLSPYYTEIGIATIETKFQGQNTTLVVQIFGAPPQNIAQPWVSNISINWSPLTLNQGENLLTHSITGQSLLPTNLIEPNWIANDKLTPKQNKISKLYPLVYLDSNNNALYYNKSFNKVNKFLEQTGYLLPVLNFLTIIISIILILSMCYFYFFYFSYIHRLMSAPRV